MNILNGKNHNVSRESWEEFLDVVDNGGPGIYTFMQIRDKKTGKLLFSTHNTTVLSGRIALIEEMFGLSRNKEQHLLLNNMLGINHSETDNVLNSSTIKRECNYFMVGNGAASTEVPGKYFSPKNYETKLYKPVPFRMVPLSNDLSAAEQEQYRFRKIVNVNGTDYVCYYAKKFTPSSVFLEYNAGAYKPIESHTTPVDENDSTHPLRGGSVLVYTTFSLPIEEEELKEYFRITSNITDCGTSETGLIYAADLPNANDNNRSELAAAELFTKMCSNKIDLSSDGSSRIVTYKVYAK